MRADSTGALWVPTDADGLFRLRGTEFIHYTTRDGLAGKSIWNILIDRSGVVWIGTGGGGLSRLYAGNFSPMRQTTVCPTTTLPACLKTGTARYGSERAGAGRCSCGTRISRPFPRGTGYPVMSFCRC